jgi:hypothetical protein
MNTKIISTCIISLFLFKGHENDAIEINKEKTSSNIELSKNNIELSSLSIDLDCNE